jgi:hypothetical protein
VRDACCAVVDLKADRPVRVKIAGGRILEEITTYDLVTRADAIISVPVMKTHDQARIRVIHSEGTCTGCRNGLLSSLFDMREDGSIERARGMTVVAGPAPLPLDISEERLVSVGTCALPEARRLPRHVKGCPPNNGDIIRAPLGSA